MSRHPLAEAQYQKEIAEVKPEDLTAWLNTRGADLSSPEYQEACRYAVEYGYEFPRQLRHPQVIANAGDGLFTIPKVLWDDMRRELDRQQAEIANLRQTLKDLSPEPYLHFQLESETPIHDWFELTYAQFLTVPRLVMQSMPVSWQRKMVTLLIELGSTFDWRPKDGDYWVRVRRDGKLEKVDADICDYRHGSVEHLRKKHKP